MSYSKRVVVVTGLVPFFAKSFKEDLVKSDHSKCPHQTKLTASQHLQEHKANALTERAH